MKLMTQLDTLIQKFQRATKRKYFKLEIWYNEWEYNISTMMSVNDAKKRDKTTIILFVRQIDEIGLSRMATFLENWKTLKVITISNDYNNNCFHQLLYTILHLYQLDTLILHRCHNYVINLVINELHKNLPLKKLAISSFIKLDFNVVKNAMINNKTLRVLDLQRCNINDSNIESIIELLKNNSTLLKLGLSNNNISMVGRTTILNSFTDPNFNGTLLNLDMLNNRDPLIGYESLIIPNKMYIEFYKEEDPASNPGFQEMIHVYKQVYSQELKMPNTFISSNYINADPAIINTLANITDY